MSQGSRGHRGHGVTGCEQHETDSGSAFQDEPADPGSLCWSVFLHHIKLIRSQQESDNWLNPSMHQETVQPGRTERQVEDCRGTVHTARELEPVPAVIGPKEPVTTSQPNNVVKAAMQHRAEASIPLRSSLFSGHFDTFDPIR